MANVVTTKDELKVAKERGDMEIVVTGEFADKLKTSKKITKLNAGALAIISVAIAAATVTAPVTGGMSFFAAAPVAALTGTEIAAIIIASSIGLTMLIAIFKDYEEISYSKGKLVLRKKQSDNGSK